MQPYTQPPAIVINIGDERSVPLTPYLRKQYEKLYKGYKFNYAYKPQLDWAVGKVQEGQVRYQDVSAETGVPWYVVGVIHLLECDCRFDCHLHNGDPLKKKTVNVPKGRPLLKHWEWEDSAIDALQLEGLDTWKDWSIAGTLYTLEAYNGFGYRNRGRVSPYLWSGTTYYKGGKYKYDGKYDPKLVSKDVGVVPVLWKLDNLGVIRFPEDLSLPTKEVDVR